MKYHHPALFMLYQKLTTLVCQYLALFMVIVVVERQLSCHFILKSLMHLFALPQTIFPNGEKILAAHDPAYLVPATQ